MAVQPKKGPLPSEGLFAETHWSMVLRAKGSSETALGTLCSSYRRPLIVWLYSRTGRCGLRRSAEDVEDTVQGFFAHLLKRDFLKNVSAEKGRFRTFFLNCFKNYILDEEAKASASKRGGGETPVSLDERMETGQPAHEVAASDVAPDREYDRAWAGNVLTNALSRLRKECALRGHSALFTELEPVMFFDETASPYADISERLGMSEGAVKMAAHRVRARLQALVQDEVLQTVANPDDWQDEVRYLISLFAKS